MKTIQIEDALYEQLVALAGEIATQDSHSTGTPYLFQVRSERKVWDGGRDGEHLVLRGNDWEEIGPFTGETIRQYCENYEIDVPDWVGGLDSGITCDWEYDNWIKQQGLFIDSYSIGYKLENGFLTGKACRSHIQANGHHYSEPSSYVSHCFRNPELELVFKFLSSLHEGQTAKG